MCAKFPDKCGNSLQRCAFARAPSARVGVGVSVSAWGRGGGEGRRPSDGYWGNINCYNINKRAFTVDLSLASCKILGYINNVIESCHN